MPCLPLTQQSNNMDSVLAFQRDSVSSFKQLFHVIVLVLQLPVVIDSC